MVVLFHLEIAGHFESWLLVRNAWLFVDFFFVLSGFIMAAVYGGRLRSWRDVGGFLIRRVGRLWPLHLAVLALFVASELAKLLAVTAFGLSAGEPAFSGPYSPETLLPSILLLHALNTTTELSWNAPSWSISAEFWTYVVFALAAPLAVKRPVATAGLVGGLGYLAVAALSPDWMDATIDYGWARCLAGFFTGGLAFMLWRRYGLGMCLGTGTEVAALTLVLLFVAYAGHGPVTLLAPLVFAAVVIACAGERGLPSRLLAAWPLVLLGDWSYSIYLTHAFVVAAGDRLTTLIESALNIPLHRGPDPEQLMVGSVWLMDGVALGYLVLTVVLASITYRWIEMPCRAMSARLAQRVEVRWLPARS